MDDGQTGKEKNNKKLSQKFWSSHVLNKIIEPFNQLIN